MVECDLPKVEIAGSSPVSRSMVTKGMFWKRFYFVVVLLSCNCFLLCSSWSFCKSLKNFFCWGSSETTTHGKDVNLDNNINNNNNLVNELENSEENKSNSNNREIDLSQNNNLFLPCDTSDENKKNIMGDLSKLKIPKCNELHPLKWGFLSATNCVGKTSIIKSLLKGGSVDEDYIPTISCDFLCQVNYKDVKGEAEMFIQLWDSPGNENLREEATNAVKNASAIVFVYDITNKDSFIKLQDYIKEIKEKDLKDCQFFLLGNKLDSFSVNQVKTEDAQKFANDNDLIFLGECSAKWGTYKPSENNSCFKGQLGEDGACLNGIEGIVNDIAYNLYKKEDVLA